MGDSMTAPALIAYPPELCGQDGYPYAWHGKSAADPVHGGTVYEMDDSFGWVQTEVEGLHPAIKHYIREITGYRCQRCFHPYPPGITKKHPRGEWTPCDVYCTHGEPVRTMSDERDFEDGAHVTYVWKEAQWRILTVHHLDEDKANCRWWNLAALCQRCHLRMQRAVVMGRPYHFEHSAWFKPYAAGFYAWKYLDEDLSREETMERLDELLALEHRFTQEVLT